MFRSFLVFSLSLFLSVPISAEEAASTSEPNVLRLGMMAFKEDDLFTTYIKEDDFILRTLPSLLAEKLPSHRIETKVYRTHELVEAARRGEVDILFGSSGCFASLLPDGIYPLATIVTNRAPDPNEAVSGALIVRADRKDLQTIEDLQRKRAMSGLDGMFFHYQMPMSAITDRGFEPDSFFSSLKRVDFPVLKVLEALNTGSIDVGLLRACVLEELPQSLRNRYRVIEPVQDSPLRCAHTARLFPNWTVGAMKHVPSETAKQVALALLSMPPQTDAGIRWSLANSFSEVESLFRTLKLGRYEYLRHWTVRRVWNEFWPFFLAGAVALLGLLIHLRRVHQLVDERTKDLRDEMEARHRLEERNRSVTERFHRLERMSTMGMISNMVAHDLRQPLTALRYGLYTIGKALAKDGRQSEVVEKAIAQSRRQIERINEIVEHVRKYSKDARRDEVLSLTDLVREALAEASQLGVLTSPGSLQSDEGVYIRGNHLELKLVLLNLIKNSVQGAGDAPAEISVSVERTPTSAVLVFADRSPGVTPDLLERMTSGMPSTKADGLGLGLTIVRSILDAHGASIRFESRDGGGLRVTLTFPPEEVA